ncbi:MAG: hypothetical protein Q9165_003410 [Trypethelium subeluteriae]
MAPPPPANRPLGERFMAIAQTLQFAWFGGHLTLLLCVLRYGISYFFMRYYSRWAQFSYRTAFVAAAATYGIVVYKAYRARMRSGKAQGGTAAAIQFASDENVQYLGETPCSVKQSSTRFRYTDLKPPQTALSESIGKFVKGYYDTSMTLVAVLEIGLFFRILGSVIILQKGAFLLLIIYSVFLRARYAQSSFVQQVVAQAGSRLDVYAADQRTPPVVRQVWEQAKGLLHRGVELTDIRRYAQGPQQSSGPKKAQ